MQLEKLKAENIPRIARWNIALHEDEGSAPMTIHSAESRLQKWLLNETFHILDITVDGRSVGYLIYHLVPPIADVRGAVESVYIRQFYIDREARRSGYGRKAIELFVANFVSHEQLLKLDVKVTNSGGRQFWESLGFEAEHVAYTRASPVSQNSPSD